MILNSKYKWLARDKDGNLGAFNEKPKKDINDWCFAKGGMSLDLLEYTSIRETDSTYSFIEWEDEEPYKIENTNKEEPKQ